MGKRGITGVRALIASAVTVTLALVGAMAGTAGASAVSGSDFNPGYIISDANFWDYNSMTADEIEAFIQSKVSVCRGTNGVPCLRDYVGATSTRAANSYCSQFDGGPSDNAGWTIWKVAQACKVSPKVLIVLVQKESGLITSNNPTQARYNAATGYGCPDTAPCDSQYYGFYNQVYKAAWQFRSYAAGGRSWRYHVGNVAIQWSPNASCGAPVVNILNQATANLYNYTPYQPNAAALANLNGTGDACSSYGNRNFWTYFWAWFGDPTGNTNPIGVIDQAWGAPGTITVGGWAIDPDAPDPLAVHVYVDGVRTIVTADDPRPDLAAVFPTSGTAHGWHLTATGMSVGPHVVCAYAINIGFGGNSSLGCATATVPTGNPFGVIDSATVAAGKLTVSGWMLDYDSVDPLTVRVAVDGAPAGTVTAGGTKSGLSKSFPGYGDGHGFTATVPSLRPGRHVVCVTGVNVGPGVDSAPVCAAVVSNSGTPFGVFDSISGQPGQLSLTGWLLDWDTTAPVAASVTVDGIPSTTLTADVTKAGLDSAFPGYGDGHGYRVTVGGLTGGPHVVCIVPRDDAGATGGSQICSRAVVPTGPPLGVVDGVSVSPGRVDVHGWSLDPDTLGPIQVRLTVDGAVVATATADQDKAGLDSSFPGYGDAHGYALSASGLSAGRHSVCVIGVNVGSGSDSWPYCVPVTMPTGNPFGVIDGVDTSRPGAMTVSGWMLDPDVVDPVTVRMYVDGQPAASGTANGTKTGLDAAFPHYGDNHAYSLTATGLTPGAHQICVVGVNVGGGVDSGRICTVASGPTGNPFGVIDSISATNRVVTIAGWGIDPDTAAPIQVSVRVDGTEAARVTADGLKSGLDSSFPGYGDSHLYTASVPVAAGTHQVCVYGINQYGGTVDANYFDCKAITVG